MLDSYELNQSTFKIIIVVILSENVIPGNHGKVFETNAESKKDLEEIKTSVLSVEGVSDVLVDNSSFPREFTVFTSAFVKIEVIKRAVADAGFHAIPRMLFHL